MGTRDQILNVLRHRMPGQAIVGIAAYRAHPLIALAPTWQTLAPA
jgi:hypothetical protein